MPNTPTHSASRPTRYPCQHSCGCILCHLWPSTVMNPSITTLDIGNPPNRQPELFFFVLHRPVAAWHFFFQHDASQRSQNNKGAWGTSIHGEKKKWKEEAKLEVVWQPYIQQKSDIISGWLCNCDSGVHCPWSPAENVWKRCLMSYYLPEYEHKEEALLRAGYNARVLSIRQQT